MHQSQMHYLPLAPGYFSALVVLFLVLLLLIQLGALRYAYMRLGVSSRTALILLFGSLIGSYFNIPIAQLPQEHVVMGREIDFFGDALRRSLRRAVAMHRTCCERRRRRHPNHHVDIPSV
jgi:uncharacterized membrane protein